MKRKEPAYLEQTRIISHSIRNSGILKTFAEQSRSHACCIHANLNILYAMLGLLLWLLRVSGVYKVSNPATTVSYLSTILILAIPSIRCLREKGTGKNSRVWLMLASIIGSGIVVFYNAYQEWLYMVMPILISCRYLDVRFTLKTIAGVVCTMVIVTIASVPFCMFACHSNIDISGFGYVASQIPRICTDPSLPKFWSDMMSLTGRTLLKFSAGPEMPGMIAFFFVAFIIAHEGSNVMKWAVHSAKTQEELKSKIMLTQLQPHFLYNTLSAIMAIEGNPDETVDAIAEFGQYLRENLQSIDALELIPFDKEIEHVKRYMSLQMLRFGDKLSIEYDLSVSDFMLPPLTVQILVENAVRHGIQPKNGKGKIIVSTYASDGDILISVKDDGVGFDTAKLAELEKSAHIGLESVRSRLFTQLNGKIESIHSMIGQGTEVVIRLPYGC